MTRSCGECTVCCTVPGLAAFDKPCYEDCKNLLEKKCVVYKQRPDECRSFQCQWLWGNVPGEDRRPDKLGIMFSWGPMLDGHHALIAWEVWPNAFEQVTWAKLTYLLDKMPAKLRSYPVVFLIYGTRLPSNTEFVGNGKYFRPKISLPMVQA